MSSLEIAELTDKRHADVIRDIEKMMEDLKIDERKFASVYKAGNGEERKCYQLPRRECLILVSGYNIKLRALIIDRWEELEALPYARGDQFDRRPAYHELSDIGQSYDLYTPTEIGDMLPKAMGAVTVNNRFINLGLQTRTRDGRECLYWLTDAGKHYGRVTEVRVRKETGSLMHVIRWMEGVLRVL